MPNNSILGDGGIHHVALRVRDFEASVKFYSDVLGFVEKIRWNESPKRIALLDTGNGSYSSCSKAAASRPREMRSGTSPSASPMPTPPWNTAAQPAAKSGSNPRR